MNESHVVVGCGPRHVESLLLDELAARRPRVIAELSAPLRLVVPSEALRRHLNRRLVQRFGALVGVQVQTLVGVAREISENAGRSAQVHDAAFELMVRRLAAHHPLLGPGFAELEDGYGAVVGAVRDLLDAGLELAHAEALLEKIAELAEGGATGERLQRAQAVVELAAAVGEWGRETGAQRVTSLHSVAQLALEERGASVFPARAVLVHGFADLTALAGDLISTLIRVCGGVVFMDRPCDPADAQRPDPGADFLERSELRFAGLPLHAPSPRAGTAGALRIFEAQDAEQQAAAVAREIRRLLDNGGTAEEMGVVARDLTPFLSSIWRHFERLGVPFSAPGVAVDGAGAARRTRALLTLVDGGGRAPMETWLEARGKAGGEWQRVPLALRVLGVKRLADLHAAAAELTGRDVRLPVAAAGDGPSWRALELPVSTLVMEAQRVGELCDLVGSWPESAAAAVHRERLLEAVEIVGWDDARAESVDGVLTQLANELAPLAEVDRVSWCRLAARALEESTTRRLGGAGAGVQVMTVMEARSCSFERLFVVGVERGIFPRQVIEDPLLPDTVRGRLLELLPQLPVKARGWAEDSYLFAQLVAAAPEVWCVWGRRRDGADSSASPFIDRLSFAGHESTPVSSEATPGNALEGALEQALTRMGGPRLEPWLTAAIQEGRERSGHAATLVPAPELARARRELLEVVEGARGLQEPSPLWGLVGTHEVPGAVTVTLLEAMAQCPWQALVTRILGVDRVRDPVLEFPGFDPRLRGEMVHRVLQDIATAGIDEPPRSLARATTAASPWRAEWPDDQLLEETIEAGVRAVLRRHRVLGPVPVPLLVATLRPYLEIARRLEWDGGRAVPVLGAELAGEVELAGGFVTFRVDRVDEVVGGLRFVDYKTGKPMSPDAKPETRLEHLRRSIGEGVNLQLAAYLHSARVPSSVARYVYLSPAFEGHDQTTRLLELGPDDAAAEAAFTTAVGHLLAARRAGVWIPRADTTNGRKAEPACERRCRVREACIRDDTDQRRRLQEWLEGLAAGEAASSSGLTGIVAELWRLGAAS